METNELARKLLDIARADPDDYARLEVPDSDLAPLVVAVNLFLERIRHEHEVLRRDASVGRRMLEASTVGVVLVDGDGLISYVNPTARRMLPPRVEPMGRKPIVAFPIAELQEVVSLAMSGVEPEPVECNLGRMDIIVTASDLPGGGAMVTLRDVTGDREAQRARTDFVANVSHELRTPVTAIMGYAETMLLERERLPEDLAAMLEKIDRNARRLRDLFEDLLQLHRIESRRRELPLAEHALRPILEEAVIGAADKAVQRGQSFTLTCPASMVANCNPEALRTMVANLASNAVNYTPSGGNIAVTATETSDEVVVSVVDDGIGIDPVHQQRIFERFYRVDDARSRALGGTGLGLALVKHLALASRSRISVESAAGRGSRFRIHLRKVRR
ncbi:MAG: PAS domain-containing protein [Alphaproteobacteria bacterium]|nr:PAS domain-containing protein [Alphaproteobacteria bacterium]